MADRARAAPAAWLLEDHGVATAQAWPAAHRQLPTETLQLDRSARLAVEECLAFRSGSRGDSSNKPAAAQLAAFPKTASPPIDPRSAHRWVARDCPRENTLRRSVFGESALLDCYPGV